MKQSFTAFLLDNNFEPEQAQQLSDKAEAIELPAQTTLTQQGTMANHIHFVNKGLCHACYLTPEGKKFSKEFYWAGDFFINFESLIKQQPSPYLIETLAPSQLVRLPLIQVQEWRKQRHPLYLKLLENQLIYKEIKERFMLLHSPEERYQLFAERYSDLEQRLADYQVASYIGITPISLSRIKKRLQS